MITVSVTSHSSLPELYVAERTLADLIKLAIGRDMGEPKAKPTFNETELAEAETLGKPVYSTVGAEVWQTAHVDMTVNTSVPTPQSVFGQPAQTTANVANPVAPVTDDLAVDADGLTWDSRIHSSSKEFNKDGTWRKRRGVNTDLVTQVEAELRGVGLPQGSVTPVPTANVQEVVATRLYDQLMTATATEFANVTGKSLEHSAPKPPVDHSHEGETPVFTATISTDMTFPELLDGVTKAMVAGQLTQARINEALNSINVEALPHLIARADLIPAFREALGGVV